MLLALEVCTYVSGIKSVSSIY